MGANMLALPEYGANEDEQRNLFLTVVDDVAGFSKKSCKGRGTKVMERVRVFYFNN
ncbi:hypothetical protein HAX54_025994, partial [Datura stramonium]|nr:hypothetical protein [Datura stramonium]